MSLLHSVIRTPNSPKVYDVDGSECCLGYCIQRGVGTGNSWSGCVALVTVYSGELGLAVAGWEGAGLLPWLLCNSVDLGPAGDLENS